MKLTDSGRWDAPQKYVVEAQLCFSGLQECAGRLAAILMTAELMKSR